MPPASKTTQANSRRSRNAGVFPDHLISRAVLNDLRTQLAEHEITLPADEPEWAKLGESLARQHGLTSPQAVEMMRALERLWLLPFHRYDTCAPHILFVFTALPEIEARFRREKDEDGLLLTRAYRVVAGMLLQGCAIFPGEPHHIASHLRQAIESPVMESRTHALPLAALFASATDGLCGNNRSLAKEPNHIALYEHQARHGRYEGVLATDYKYESYCRKVTASKEFWREWKDLKAAFQNHHFWDKGGIVRRTAIPEGNWHRERLPHPRSIRDRFQMTFDVFCWKWFLYGMKQGSPRDEPLVQKPSYAFTPYGTQIFIPGYWSIDLNRDFNWEEIATLHRARGIPKQGEKADRNKEELMAQAKRAQEADREAKQNGLRGEKRYQFIKQKVGLDVRTDNAHIRRMIQFKGWGKLNI